MWAIACPCLNAWTRYDRSDSDDEDDGDADNGDKSASATEHSQVEGRPTVADPGTMRVLRSERIKRESRFLQPIDLGGGGMISASKQGIYSPPRQHSPRGSNARGSEYASLRSSSPRASLRTTSSSRASFASFASASPDTASALSAHPDAALEQAISSSFASKRSAAYDADMRPSDASLKANWARATVVRGFLFALRCVRRFVGPALVWLAPTACTVYGGYRGNGAFLPKRVNARRAPPIVDLLWANMSVGDTHKRARFICTNLVLVTIVIFCVLLATVLTRFETFFQFLSGGFNNELAILLPGTDFATNCTAVIAEAVKSGGSTRRAPTTSSFYSFLLNYTPPILIYLLLSVLLPFLIWLASFSERHLQVSTRETSMFTKNILLNFLICIVIPAFALNSINAVTDLYENLQCVTDWRRRIGEQLLQPSSQYFLTFLVHSALLGAGMQYANMPQARVVGSVQAILGGKYSRKTISIFCFEFRRNNCQHSFSTLIFYASCRRTLTLSAPVDCSLVDSSLFHLFARYRGGRRALAVRPLLLLVGAPHCARGCAHLGRDAAAGRAARAALLCDQLPRRPLHSVWRPLLAQGARGDDGARRSGIARRHFAERAAAAGHARLGVQ